MELETCKLIDRDDKLVGAVKLYPRPEGGEPRSVICMGKRFEETDGGFYGPGELIEVDR
jgi:hypothetical protein